MTNNTFIDSQSKFLLENFKFIITKYETIELIYISLELRTNENGFNVNDYISVKIDYLTDYYLSFKEGLSMGSIEICHKPKSDIKLYFNSREKLVEYLKKEVSQKVVQKDIENALDCYNGSDGVGFSCFLNKHDYILLRYNKDRYDKNNPDKKILYIKTNSIINKKILSEVRMDSPDIELGFVIIDLIKRTGVLCINKINLVFFNNSLKFSKLL